MSREVTMDVVGCARCRGDGHEGLTFAALDNPVEIEGKDGMIVLTHWTPCPTNGQPILLAFVEP